MLFYTGFTMMQRVEWIIEKNHLTLFVYVQLLLHVTQHFVGINEFKLLFWMYNFTMSLWIIHLKEYVRSWTSNSTIRHVLLYKSVEEYWIPLINIKKKKITEKARNNFFQISRLSQLHNYRRLLSAKISKQKFVAAFACKSVCSIYE